VRAVVVLVLLLARVAAADCPHDKQLAIARGSATVDGLLDDPVWQHACFADDLVQKQPAFGAPPTHPVKVAVAIDGDTLYIGARMWSAGPDDIDDALTQRDDTAQAERFIVSLDPSHTKRLAYSFAVTAQGVRADWIHTDDTEFDRDLSWNPVWVAKARILADGWSAEMAIPLSQLRLPREPATSWGINFNWYIPHRQEDVFWRAVPPDQKAWASYFGELVGLPPVSPGLALELLPYAASRLVIDEAPGDHGRLAHRWRAGFDAGLDAKLRPLPGLTISATINPDFAQVDADPAFVNLTAFEVHLPEKRPFFVENNSLFANTVGGYFYSRRIGGLPLALPSADAIDLPPEVRILGAIAAGGYVEARTQIAAVAAVTDEASADAIVAGRKTELVVSPLTAWGAARVEHQVGTSVFSGVATLAERALGGTGLSGLLPQTAITASTDARLRTKDSRYELTPFAGVSSLSGTPEAIAAVEQRSAHYFQRPDDPRLHVDTTAHHLLGWDAGLYGAKRAGLWQGEVSGEAQSPGFDLNDVGAFNSADDLDAYVAVTRTETTPTKHVFAWQVGSSAFAEWNLGGLRKPVALAATGGVTFASFSQVGATLNVSTPGDSDDLTRGGPVMHTGIASSLAVNASTPGGRVTQLSGGVSALVSPTLDQGLNASATLTARVVPALRLDLSPSLSIVETHRQYVATVTDGGGGGTTYGARYLFGHLARKEAALQLRATWSLSPDMVITVYAQPFVSVGRYDALGELAAAGSGDVRWYDQTSHLTDTRAISDGGDAFVIAEPDYSFASLRSTAVLRWEPAPGSTLFIVWQQQRGGAATSIAQPLHGAVPEVFTQSAIHTIAIKLSYWFG
jgi:hypothetical protein